MISCGCARCRLRGVFERAVDMRGLDALGVTRVIGAAVELAHEAMDAGEWRRAALLFAGSASLALGARHLPPPPPPPPPSPESREVN